MYKNEISYQTNFNTDQKIRLDTLLTRLKNPPSRSQWAHLIKAGHVSVDGRKPKPGYIIKGGEYLVANIPPPQPLDLTPEEIPLDIIHEDEDLIVINKSPGLVVHPGAGNYQHTLVHALLFHCKDLSGIGGKQRPGIVHRLDKDTSGLLVVAKNDLAHNSLSNQIKEKKTKKIYTALVWGELEKRTGSINVPIKRHPVHRKKMYANLSSGKKAVTSYKVVEYFGDFTLLEISLITGRTHQIRVHLNYINHPIVGDMVYGHHIIKNKWPEELKHAIKSLKGQALCAQRLGFYHPRSNKYVEFYAPLPTFFEKLIEIIRSSFNI